MPQMVTKKRTRKDAGRKKINKAGIPSKKRKVTSSEGTAKPPKSPSDSAQLNTQKAQPETPQEPAIPSRRAQLQALQADMASLVQAGRADQAVEALLSLVANITADNERMSVLIAKYATLLFGRRSERLSRDELQQLALAFGASEEEAQLEAVEVPIPAKEESLSDDGQGDDEGEDEGATRKTKKKRPNHPGRTRLAAELKRDITVTPVEDSEKCCVVCGAEMEVIGYQKHERIEYVPASILVHEEHCEKRGCKACRGDATTASRAQTPAIVGRAGASILARLIEATCDDAQPINHQAEQFARLGWQVPTSTLYGYWKYALELLEPVGKATESAVLGHFVVGIDDTRLDYLDENQRSSQKRGHLWCFSNKGGMVAYVFTTSWCAQDIAPSIYAVDHFVQVDDYKGYGSQVEINGQKVILVPEDKRLGCGMHIRRRYRTAQKMGDLRAAVPILYFKQLYDIEKKIRGAPPDERLAVRGELSVPILKEFDSWLKTHRDAFRPTEPLASAVDYHRQQLPFFKRCFEDGRFEIDNGDCERALRRVAMGRNLWLFTGASTGGPRLATAFTLVESCRRLGLPTQDYLIDVITKVEQGWPVRRVSELIPDRWGIERGLIVSP